MFKNLKVRVSLALGFGITIIISVAIIILMLLIIDYQSTTYSSIINSQVKANELILQCRIYTNIAARNVRDMALEPSDPQNETTQATIDENIAELETVTKQLIAIYPLKDKGLEEYTNAMQEWYNEVPDILNAVNSGNQKEAIRIIKSECTPKLNNMIGIAKSISANLLKEQNRIIAKQQETSQLAETVMIIAAAVAALFVIFIALRLIASITKPVKQVSVALKGFSMGQLDIPVTYKSRSELGGMCDALRTSQHVLTELISDECHILDEMASGNFDVKTKDENIYVGALGNILKSIRAINRNLSDAIGQIMQGAEQVASEAMQVSNGSQSLAQGSTEQASSVEQLASTIVEISNNSKNNAHNSEQASAQSKLAGRQVEESVRLMGEMVLAMEKISSSSNEIGKIIATIENIAFQTNILALNASVEAARAGEAGKGFSVVSGEVRNLASKSAEAARNTTELINRSVNDAKTGTESSDLAISAMQVINDCIQSIKVLMDEISLASVQQSEMIVSVENRIKEVSKVIQANSDAAGESAAVSNELSSQARTLNSLISRFQID